MIPEFLVDAFVEDLKALFQHHRRKNSMGAERAINVFPFGPPIREGDDEGEDTEAPPEPYITVKIVDGEILEEEAPHIITVVLIASVYDRDPKRQGYKRLNGDGYYGREYIKEAEA